MPPVLPEGCAPHGLEVSTVSYSVDVFGRELDVSVICATCNRRTSIRRPKPTREGLRTWCLVIATDLCIAACEHVSPFSSTLEKSLACIIR